MEVAESCCNSMRVDDTCCIFGSIISDYCPTLNAPVAFTLTIELAQLISNRGLFEFDDVFHNALGTAAGVLLVLGLRRLRK